MQVERYGGDQRQRCQRGPIYTLKPFESPHFESQRVVS